MDLNQLEKLPIGARVATVIESNYCLAEIIKYCFEHDLVIIPIDPKLPKHRIDFIIQHSEASVVVRNDSFDELSKEFHRPKGDFLIIYTSGSTGEPKGVVLSKEAVVANAKQVGKIHGFDKGSAHATCLPLYHCNALCMSLVGSIVFRQKFLLLEKFSVEEYFKLIEENDVATASIVPALLEKIVQERHDLPKCLDYFITAAAPLSSNLALRFYNLYGPKLVQGYGLSEAVNFSFVMPKLDEDDFVTEYIQNHPPVGIPVQGTEVKIVDGEVLVKGQNLMREYLKNPMATKDAFDDDGFLKTGDLGAFRGKFLVLQGRKKEVINRGGETIYPIDIEETWQGLEVPSVAMAVSNNLLGDDIGMCIETTDPVALATQISKLHYRPVAVQTGKILRTSVGKPQRKKMGESLVSNSFEPELYKALLNRCHEIARKITGINLSTKERTRAAYILNQAELLYRESGYTKTSAILDNDIAYALDVFEEEITDLMCDRATGEDVMQRHKGLWRKLMSGFPMGQYAQLCASFLIARNLLQGEVLELGAGIGNTSNLLESYVSKDFIRSDLGRDLNSRFSIGKYMSIDFDSPLSIRNQQTIFATNAIHCAGDKQATLNYIYDSLTEGGYFVLAEGEPITHKNTPWALNMFYGMFDGWWNVSGFIQRTEWLEMFKNAGFKDIGWSVLRAGHHDLGGLIWGRK